MSLPANFLRRQSFSRVQSVSQVLYPSLPSDLSSGYRGARSYAYGSPLFCIKIKAYILGFSSVPVVLENFGKQCRI